MNLFISLKAALLAMQAVTDLVGGTNSETVRIWNSWQRVNGPGSEPCIIMDVDREDQQNDLGGSGDLVVADVTVTCRGRTHDESDALCEAVKSNGGSGGLAGYHGAFDAILDDVVHSETPKNDGSEKYWYDHVMTFTMLWNE
jgi:hypothetical protein